MVRPSPGKSPRHAGCGRGQTGAKMEKNERRSMQDVSDIYDSLMSSIPDTYDTTDILAALTLVLKDVAVFHHGNLHKAQRASVVALDTSFTMEAAKLPSAAIH